MPKTKSCISRYAEIDEFESAHGHYFRVLDPLCMTESLTHPYPEFFITGDRSRFEAYREAVKLLKEKKPHAKHIRDGIPDVAKKKRRNFHRYTSFRSL